MEATRGLTYVRIFSETNEVTCGNHIVSNSSLFDLGGNNYAGETDKFCVGTSTRVHSHILCLEIMLDLLIESTDNIQEAQKPQETIVEL
jgi:hypothetical protein